ncbi:PREDICTED: uncharacterized protein LOC106743936 [Dinoponera quadriceps]|uniref:phospholipase A2 n=1 Tax=Dinoponera quadriceps TaxID=609295 RepID=A0A6P3X699_DINQU|nr:PREDICTED: uncharacterized protein LOC106743936 [Dinoponera quadriceps]
MSHLRFCLFAFLALVVVAGFTSSQDVSDDVSKDVETTDDVTDDVTDDICMQPVEPGSESAKLSFLEKSMKNMKDDFEKLGNNWKARVERMKKFAEEGTKWKKEMLGKLLGITGEKDIDKIFESIIQEPREWATTMMEKLQRASDARKDGRKNLLDDFMKEMKKNIETKKKDIEELIKEQQKNLGDKWQNMKENMKENMNNLKENMENRWNKLLGKKSEEPKKVCYGDTLNKMGKEFQLIFPGTKWCGDGDIAVSDDDLGRFSGLDKCCRAHDKCYKDIAANDTLGNLKNDGLFTKSACSCDSEFYNCLKAVNCPIANQIGWTYFNILQPQCFTCRCPKEDCDTEKDENCLNSCERYEWIDNPRY